MASKEVGNLGVGSLFAFNRAMMFKWRWRFFHHSDLLWVRVIKTIYGVNSGLSSLSPRGSSSGIWNNIIYMLVNLTNRGFDLLSVCPIRVGDGAATSFWQDKWFLDNPLATSFHRIYALDNHKSATVRDRVGIGWDLGNLLRMPRGGIDQSQWAVF